MNLSHEVWEWIRSIAVAVVLALIIRSFLFQVYDVEGSSMYPTLEQNNRLIVNKLVYRFREPAPGDIVVFDYEPERPFIKRVIGTGSDTIMIREGQVYRNGLALSNPTCKTGARCPISGRWRCRRATSSCWAIFAATAWTAGIPGWALSPWNRSAAKPR